MKTIWYKSNHWRLGQKDENTFADDFFYVFVRLNEMKEHPEYWIVPSQVVSLNIKERHKIWLNMLGKMGQKHNDNPGRTFTIVEDKFTPLGFSYDLKKNDLNLILEYGQS